MVKGYLTVFWPIGISIAAVGGCTEPTTVIQRIALLRGLAEMMEAFGNFFVERNAYADVPHIDNQYQSARVMA